MAYVAKGRSYRFLPERCLMTLTPVPIPNRMREWVEVLVNYAYWQSTSSQSNMFWLSLCPSDGEGFHQRPHHPAQNVQVLIP